MLHKDILLPSMWLFCRARYAEDKNNIMTSVLLVANPGHHARNAESDVTVALDPSSMRCERVFTRTCVPVRALDGLGERLNVAQTALLPAPHRWQDPALPCGMQVHVHCNLLFLPVLLVFRPVAWQGIFAGRPAVQLRY